MSKETTRRPDLFERLDGGHCYIRIIHQSKEFRFARCPFKISYEDMKEIALWICQIELAEHVALGREHINKKARK